MYDSKDKIAAALIGADKVLSHPKMLDPATGLPRIPVSLDDMYDVVCEISGYTVNLNEVKFSAKYLHGRFERYKDNVAEIDIRDDLSDADKRFVTAKELMHLVVDTDDDYCPYGDEIIDELIDRGLVGKFNFQEDITRPAASDVITEIAATEVLIPLSLRPKTQASVQSGETTYSKLAIEYDVPSDRISLALNASYLEHCLSALKAKVEKIISS